MTMRENIEKILCKYPSSWYCVHDMRSMISEDEEKDGTHRVIG